MHRIKDRHDPRKSRFILSSCQKKYSPNSLNGKGARDGPVTLASRREYTGDRKHLAKPQRGTVTPASCRLSRGHPAPAEGETPSGLPPRHGGAAVQKWENWLLRREFDALQDARNRISNTLRLCAFALRNAGYETQRRKEGVPLTG